MPTLLLALDGATPNLRPMLTLVAKALERRPPSGHIPIPLLFLLLRVPGVARFANTYPEALHFIQPDRFDLGGADEFLDRVGVAKPPIRQAIDASVGHYLRENGAPSPGLGRR